MNQYQPPTSPTREATELLGLVACGFGGLAYWLGTQNAWIQYSAAYLVEWVPQLRNPQFPQLPLLSAACCVALIVFLALLPLARPLSNAFSRSAIDQQTARLTRNVRKRKRFKAG